MRGPRSSTFLNFPSFKSDFEGDNDWISRTTSEAARGILMTFIGTLGHDCWHISRGGMAIRTWRKIFFKKRLPPRYAVPSN
jgi:hypothetical protein